MHQVNFAMQKVQVIFEEWLETVAAYMPDNKTIAGICLALIILGLLALAQIQRDPPPRNFRGTA